ncbi:MAG: radical SAM protein [Methanobacteriota archaeon]|nr:MAG: radical SAM protein [Euryarchaeota archaeon]
MAVFAYRNGDWLVMINSDDGSKIRKTESPEPVSSFPESMDVKITDYCDAGCAWCHEDSTVKGRHGNLDRVIDLYRQLPQGVEIAIGGGNPLAHPEIEPFLSELDSMNVLANITVNEIHAHRKGISEMIDGWMERGLVKGVGYSMSSRAPKFTNKNNVVVHLIAGINSLSDIKKCMDEGFEKFLILGYKRFRRGEHYESKMGERVRRNIHEWKTSLPFIVGAGIQVSMDNLAIRQLEPFRWMKKDVYDQVYMGDDGEHTMYFDAVENMVALTSTSSVRFQNTGNTEDNFRLVRCTKNIAA